MSISEDALQSGKGLAGAAGASLSGMLNDALGHFIGNDYKAISGYVIDLDGRKSENFASVIHKADASAERADPCAVPADATAAVIDVCGELDLESFRAAYRRIAEAKTLKKTAVPKDATKTNITLGILLAARSAVPLETVAEELDRLNSKTPGGQWPDMIAVASTGVINYGVQFPGESISGDFLPPAEGALTNYVPSIYVVIIMRPTGTYAFNKILAFLVAHLGIFSPAAELPPWEQILEGVPQSVVTLTGFQYNLKGDLVPVPRQFYNDRYCRRGPCLSRTSRAMFCPPFNTYHGRTEAQFSCGANCRWRACWSFLERTRYAAASSSGLPFRFLMSWPSRRPISMRS